MYVALVVGRRYYNLGSRYTILGLSQVELCGDAARIFFLAGNDGLLGDNLAALYGSD